MDITHSRSRTPPEPIDTRTLSDDAHVNIHVASQMTGIAPGTIRNLMSMRPPKFPPAVEAQAPKKNHWRMGDIRAWLNAGRRWPPR
jgi:predicted DNA-binding transcriptional regulator AlpA